MATRPTVSGVPVVGSLGDDEAFRRSDKNMRLLKMTQSVAMLNHVYVYGHSFGLRVTGARDKRGLLAVVKTLCSGLGGRG
jgi:hypothetical protein